MALSELTAAKIDHGLAALRLDQSRGDAPPKGKVTLADIATRAGVSKATVLKLERLALTKVATELSRRGDLPPRLAKLCASILSPANPEP